MADNKKYLDLNGLGYAIRKMDNKKADIESPDFTGTPKIEGIDVATKEYVDNTIDAVNEVKLTKVVQWDNAQEGTTTAVTTNMVVLTEEEYESLDVKIPNTFYFIYDNEAEGAALNDN